LLNPNSLLITLFQQAFSSLICLVVRRNAGMAYIITLRLKVSCKFNNAISSTPEPCRKIVLQAA